MVQEPGVDEADLIKHRDGNLYVVQDRALRIVRAWPAETMESIARVPLPGRGRDMYLWQDKAVVLTQTVLYEYTGKAAPDPDYPPYYNLHHHVSRVGVSLFDISDPSSPETERSCFLDGFLLASRRIEDTLYLVVQKTLPRNEDEENEEEQQALIYTTLQGEGEPLLNVSQIVPPWIAKERNVILVAAIPLNRFGEDARGVELRGTAQIIYMSKHSCYLARSWTYYDNGYQRLTHLRKVNLEDEGPAYAGEGTVPGRLLDSYSMGEHDGHLRIATETGMWGNPSPRVTVLAEEDGRLAVVGELTDIAPQDTLDAARFVGERGYLTTSIQRWDPLFTLNLSDPTEPKIVGALELPGISTHILPISEGSLVAVGRGESGGVKVSLFDVSDFKEPALVDETHFGIGWGTNSEALFEPKAFQWYPSRNLLALPVRSYGYEEGVWTISENLAVLRVKEGEGLLALGGFFLQKKPYSWYADPGWTRSLFLEDVVYGVKKELVRAARVLDDSVSKTLWSIELE
jgi:uncharacterized secreted protein with C-terminal beta-propeller domain